MIHFKNKKYSSQAGFTLIEAVMAVAIIGMVLTPMFLLETNVFNAVVRKAEQFHRLLFAEHFMYTAQQQEPLEVTNYLLEKKEDKPLSMVRYTLKPIPNGSSLAKIKSLLCRQEVIATGIRPGSPQATLVGFVYKPAPVPS